MGRPDAYLCTDAAVRGTCVGRGRALRPQHGGHGVQGLGDLATFLEELGEYPIIEAHCDAAATISIASRLGFAKLKHIEIRHFWLQDEIREGRLVLHKIASADNPADILT